MFASHLNDPEKTFCLQENNEKVYLCFCSTVIMNFTSFTRTTTKSQKATRDLFRVFFLRDPRGRRKQTSLDGQPLSKEKLVLFWILQEWCSGKNSNSFETEKEGEDYLVFSRRATTLSSLQPISETFTPLPRITREKERRQHEEWGKETDLLPF